MTEWTADLIVPDTEVMDAPNVERLADPASDATPRSVPLADALIEDPQEDRVDWFE